MKLIPYSIDNIISRINEVSDHEFAGYSSIFVWDDDIMKYIKCNECNYEILIIEHRSNQIKFEYLYINDKKFENEYDLYKYIDENNIKTCNESKIENILI